MPPKTDKPASTAEPRRSTRLSAAPPSKVEAKDEGKKRTADKPDSKAPAAKKAKPESKPASKPAPTSKGKPASTIKKTPASKAKKSEAIPEGDEHKANGDADKTEDKEEAVAAEQPKAAEAEKKAEAPADADIEKPASKAGGKIKEGDVLPKGIKLEDEEGNEVDVGELAKDKGVVLFLYPKANTPGCTNQACGFRDHYAEIQKLGYDVYGLSADKPSPQKNWKTKHNMQYNLLCDPEYKLIKRLGSFSPPKQTKRSSFIFEKGGKLVKAHSAATPATDPKNCLEFIKSHK